MKKKISRILKKIYFVLSTSKLEDAISLRDFSKFKVYQIKEERLPSESGKGKFKINL